ncbi:MAG TPA: TRAP transporter large permease [Candidatus Acidoferrum sp.]|nr:TRAP transporter large permease [Candidatus Acidoferrum sp.]
MNFVIIWGLFLVLSVTAVPLAFSIGLTPLLFSLGTGKYPLTVIFQSIVTVNESFELLALPFFILAGELMSTGGIGKRITNFAFALVGWIPGGLAAMTVVACMIFGGVSGSAVADAAAVGSVMIPAMVKKGYGKEYAAAVVASAGTIGVIIPPSIPMVLYAFVTGVSLGDLFIAGIIPGILVGICLMICALLIALKRGYPTEPMLSFRELIRSLVDCIPALLTPLIILGSIFTGFVTPTEAAVIAVAYAILVGRFVYGDLAWADIPKALLKTGQMTAIVMLIIGAGAALSWTLTVENFPTVFSHWIVSVTHSRTMILLLVNIILLLLGGPMHLAPTLLLTTPILLPLVKQFGVDPLHFGLIVVSNLAIGISFPLLGNTVYVASKLAKVSVEHTSVALIPFILINIVAVLLITYYPPFSMWLPSLIRR